MPWIRIASEYTKIYEAWSLSTLGRCLQTMHMEENIASMQNTEITFLLQE